MKLPASEHTSRPWRIHEITGDFRLEDVWALPTPGGPGDFPVLVEGISSFDPGRGSSAAVRALFALRWKIGGLFGWDGPDDGIGSRVATLRDRLPADLREHPGRGSDTLPFRPLYVLENEYAAEIANHTVHGVMHLGWVADDDTGGYRGQMAVLVKPNGILGEAYMVAIRPFRHLVVYPAMLKEIGDMWRERTGQREAIQPTEKGAR